MSGSVFAQTPAPEPAPPPPPPAPTAPPAPAPAPPAGEEPPADEAPGFSGLRVHIVTNENTYVRMRYDVFDVKTHKLVASGRGAREDRGEALKVLELPPGVYKIVPAGDPFDSRVDYAIAYVDPDALTDFAIVVDASTLDFRGSGPVVEPLPEGTDIAGLRLSLNVGGTMMFQQFVHPVGATSGSTAQFGLFGNFGALYDKGNNFVDVDATLTLDLVDPVTGSVYPTHDLFEASGLYSYKINNDYVGPYVRAWAITNVFPGYMYLERPTAPINVQIHKLDGTTQNVTLGTQANPDNLRYQVSKPFAPLRIQEELGANFKAVDLNLLLFKLHVGTRAGFGFRQGITNGLLVAEGDPQSDDPVNLREVDDYNTLGPTIGAKAKVTFARWLFGSASFGVLAPLTNTDKSQSSGFAGRLLVDFSGTAGFKVPILTNLLYASADYTFRLERDSFLTSQTQFEQDLMVRASLTIF